MYFLSHLLRVILEGKWLLGSLKPGIKRETIVGDKDMTLTEDIYHELMDGLKRRLDWQQFIAKYSASKGPLYNAIRQFFTDIYPIITAINEEKEKAEKELDQRRLVLDSLDHKIEEAQSAVASLENSEKNLNDEIESVETKLAQKSEIARQVAELEKFGFDLERLRQLRNTLAEIGAKNGLKGKQAITKFFDDLKDYGTVLEAESQLKGLQTQIETEKLQAENWQAKEEALRRKHDDLKEAIGAVHALRTRGIKVSQIATWHRILGQFETAEQFDESLHQYGNIIRLLNARKEEAKSYEPRLAKAQSQVETLEKEGAEIEGAIDALKVAGVKELKAMTEATEKQLKAVAASEIREAQAVGREVRSEFANYFTELDRLSEKAVHVGQELERTKLELQKYERVKETLESLAVASEEAVK